MGLIQAALAAGTSVLSEQWKEYFYCEAIPANVIAVKGKKKVSGISANRGNDNIITDGSVIAVADGQCMIIVEQGKVVDICAEPGEYRYDSSTEPSLFTGNLGESVKTIFAQIGKRFEFGGQPAEDQRVYYFNTKELVGNKYGTPNPIPFRVVDKNANIDMNIRIRCFGEYSIRVVDPILFYTNVCGNFAQVYTVDEISNQLKTELLTALQPALAKLSGEDGIRYSQIITHTGELADALNEQLSAKWRDLRGIEIVSFGVSSVNALEEDEKRLLDLQRNAAFKDPGMAYANYVGSVSQAMVDAANNTAGAPTGFMAMNMAQQAGNIDAAAMLNAAQQKPAPQPAPAGNTWTCPTCGQECTDNFCPKCGTKKPESTKWFCPNCGAENNGNFCTKCGTKKPE